MPRYDVAALCLLSLTRQGPAVQCRKWWKFWKRKRAPSPEQEAAARLALQQRASALRLSAEQLMHEGASWLHVVAGGRGTPTQRADLLEALLLGDFHECVPAMEPTLVNLELHTFLHLACSARCADELVPVLCEWAARRPGGPVEVLPLLAQDLDGISPLATALAHGHETAAAALAAVGALPAEAVYSTAVEALDRTIARAKAAPPPNALVQTPRGMGVLGEGLRSLTNSISRVVDKVASVGTELQVKQAATGRSQQTEMMDLPNAAAVAALERRRKRETDMAEHVVRALSGEASRTLADLSRGATSPATPAPAAAAKSEFRAPSPVASSGVGDDGCSSDTDAALQRESAEATSAEQQDGGEIEEELCCVCYCDVDEEAPKLPCGHPVCSDCWGMHLTARIDEGDVQRDGLRCPGADCSYRLEQRRVMPLMLGRLDLVERYNKIIAEKYVACEDGVRWCPHPECQCAVALDRAGADFVADAAQSGRGVAVKCGEGHSFCWSCGLAPHEPASCAQMREWSSLCERTTADAEAANAAWLENNTERCPRCKQPIEKNDGCNHISCRCGHHFCWACMRPWSDHSRATGGSYYCRMAPSDRGPTGPRRRPRPQPKAGAEAERLRSFVLKAQRHEDMPAALRDVATRVKAVLQRTRGFHEGGDAAAGEVIATLDAAMADLETCHTYLRCSYVFGYFLPYWSVGRRYFEKMQTELEHMTEALQAVVLPTGLEQAWRAARQAGQQAGGRGGPGHMLLGGMGLGALLLGGGGGGGGARAVAVEQRAYEAAAFYHAHALKGRCKPIGEAGVAARETMSRLKAAVRSGVVTPKD